MQITFNKYTALRIIRAIRSGAASPLPANGLSTMPNTKLLPPDPSPRTRWSKTLLGLSHFGIPDDFSSRSPLDIAVSAPEQRLKTQRAHNTIYAREGGIPNNSFIDLGDGTAISGPELTFVEMASVMDLPQLALLGFELCGAFSRNPINPRNGDVALHVEPATSVAKISAFLNETKWVRGTENARWALDIIADNAWSPMESVIATLACLPVECFGYGIESCILNERAETPGSLREATAKSSRVPDILFSGTRVGINYDGAVHLDLDSVVNAAMEAERHPETAFGQATLEETVRQVRAKAVDDIRRNRELAASGYIVLPVVKEDLYEEGGLDRVMAQVFEALETFGHVDMSTQRRALVPKFIRSRRQRLIWSLIPGSKEKTHRSSTLGGVDTTPPTVREIIIGF